MKRTKAAWRREVLQGNTVLGVISLPAELFQPYAASTTAILILQHGVPHPPQKTVFFCRVENDGYRLRKGTRVKQSGSQMEAVHMEFLASGTVPGFCDHKILNPESGFAPGAYIQAKTLNVTDLSAEIAGLLRNKSAFVVQHAPELSAMIKAIGDGTLKLQPPRKARELLVEPNTIGAFFNISYGQKELHNKDSLERGRTLVISSSGMDNGCYGFFEFDKPICPPFVAVPSTGSIGEATVQEFGCGLVDDCLLLSPKRDTPIEALYVAAAVLRHEKWRFDYGRKMTPQRIAGFPLDLDADLLAEITEQRRRALDVERQALVAFGDVVTHPLLATGR